MRQHIDQSIEFNPMSADFQRDRYAVFKKIRTHCPILKESKTDHWGRNYTTWHFTSYEDVLWAFRDRRFVKDLTKVLPAEQIPPAPDQLRALQQSMQNMMAFRDPPDHTRLRSLVNQAFTPSIAKRLEPRIREIASYLLQEIEPGETFDLFHRYAYQLPIIVIAELFGAPAADRELIKEWSRNLLPAVDHNPSKEALVQANQAMIEIRDYCRDLVRERSRNPKLDLLSGLIRATHEEDRMSEDELVNMCVLILEAGHETTTNLIANSAYLVARYPEQQALLRAQPEWLESAIEEILRFEPSVQLRHRIVGEDIEYKGHLLKRGDSVAAWIASANRDPDVFSDPDPDTFDITRGKNPHLSFGQGVHFCLGAPLARREGAIALQTLLDKYERLELVEGRVEWKPTPGRRSFEELVVHVN
ncbi:cytochrome P450 [Paenibacillus sp. GYB003]|uniref:cytochrome P450 n=1 Tax=Paenibacillus sp. GYB003 TaxID=2994392 RepID=UPI002F9643A2